MRILRQVSGSMTANDDTNASDQYEDGVRAMSDNQSEYKEQTCVSGEHLHDVQDLTDSEVDCRIQAAVAQCQRRGVRFTPLRQQIYALVLKANQPIGAYDLISQLQKARFENGMDNKSHKNVAPPTVYRSLDFLLGEGLIHQLTSINAYVPCCHPRAAHTAAFLICDQCRRVQEYSSVPVQEMMNYAKEDAGFEVNHSVIELSGRCHGCQ